MSKASSIAADDDVVRFSGSESGGILGVTFFWARIWECAQGVEVKAGSPVMSPVLRAGTGVPAAATTGVVAAAENKCRRMGAPVVVRVSAAMDVHS
jgi:hypothetical protein